MPEDNSNDFVRDDMTPGQRGVQIVHSDWNDRVRASLELSHGKTAQSVAEARSVANELNVQPSIAEQILPKAKDELLARKVSENERFAEWVGKTPANAAVLRDDSTAIGRIFDAVANFSERTAGWAMDRGADLLTYVLPGTPQKKGFSLPGSIPGPWGPLAFLGDSISSSGLAADLRNGWQELKKSLWDAFLRGPVEAASYFTVGVDNPVANWFARQSKAMEDAKVEQPEARSLIGRFGREAVQNVPQLAANMAVALLTAGYGTVLQAARTGATISTFQKLYPELGALGPGALKMLPGRLPMVGADGEALPEMVAAMTKRGLRITPAYDSSALRPLGLMIAEIAGGSYGELRDQGVAPPQAMKAAAFNALAQAPLEWIGLDRFLGIFKSKSVRDTAIRTIGASATEFITEFLQQWPEFAAHEWALAGKAHPSDPAGHLAAFLDRVTDADVLYQTFLEGLESGGVGAMIGWGGGMGKAIHDRQARWNAVSQADALRTVMDLCNDAKIKQESPDIMEELVESASGSVFAQKVFIPAKAALDLKAKGVDILTPLGISEEEANRAAEQGADLETKLSSIMARLDGDAQEQASLLMREDPDGPNAQEALSESDDEEEREAQTEAREKAKTERQAARAEEVRLAREMSSLGAGAGYARLQAKMLACHARALARTYKVKAADVLKRISFKSAEQRQAEAADRALEQGVVPQSSIDMVRAKYEGTEAWMRAPNGEKTNLTEQQWCAVRTDEFKKWFGDWENDPANASKAVDENGEPLVVYHVTGEDFDTFDLSKARQDADLPAFYFSTGTEDWADMGDRVVPAFLNIRNPKEGKPAANMQGKAVREGLEAEGYDGTVEREEGAETEYAVFNPEQIKSAQGNVGTFDRKNPNIFYQESASDMPGGDGAALADFRKKNPAGTEKRKALDALLDLVSLEGAQEEARQGQWSNQLRFEKQLNDKVTALAEKAGVKLGDRKSALSNDIFVEALRRNILKAAEQNQNAIGWYAKKIRQMFNVAYVAFPELKDDEEARFAFIYALATTSNGMKVSQNAKLARQAYSEYKKTGKLPEIGSGQAAAAMKRTLKDFAENHDMFDDMDEEIRFFMTRWTVAQMGLMGTTVSGENNETVVRGAAVMGPKIGNGFFANLRGAFDALTMDRWNMRTNGRVWGRNTKDTTANIAELFAKARGMLGAEEEYGRIGDALRASIGVDIAQYDISTDDGLVAFAKAAAANYTSGAKRAAQAKALGVEEKNDEVRKTLNNIAKNSEYVEKDEATGETRYAVEVLSPTGGNQRAYIRRMMNFALGRVREERPELRGLTMADAQAVLWYGEKLLLEQMIRKPVGEIGPTAYDLSKAPDYANAMAAAIKAWADEVSSDPISQEEAARRKAKIDAALAAKKITAAEAAEQKAEVDAEASRPPHSHTKRWARAIKARVDKALAMPVEEEEDGSEFETLDIRGKAAVFGRAALANNRRELADDVAQRAADAAKGKRSKADPRSRVYGGEEQAVSEPDRRGLRGDGGVEGEAPEGLRQARLVRKWTAGRALATVLEAVDDLEAEAAGRKKEKPEGKKKQAPEAPVFLEKAGPSAEGEFSAAFEKAGDDVIAGRGVVAEGRTFLSEDGRSGFALSGDNISAAFAAEGSGGAHAAIECAKAAGGRRIAVASEADMIGCAMHGFIPVARVGDTVYMVLNEGYRGAKVGTAFAEAPVVADEAAAAEEQRKALASETVAGNNAAFESVVSVNGDQPQVFGQEANALSPEERARREQLDRDYFAAIESGDMEVVQRMVEEAAEAAGYGDAIPEQSMSYKVRTKPAPKKTKKVYKIFYVDTDAGLPTTLFVSGSEHIPLGVWLDATEPPYKFQAGNGKWYVPTTKNPNRESDTSGKTGSTIEIPNDEVRQALIDGGFLKKGSKARTVQAVAYRPGWHAGVFPHFPQGGTKIGGVMHHERNQVIYECEVAADTDYTEEAENQPKARTKAGTVYARAADFQHMVDDGFYYYTTSPTEAPKEKSWVISNSIKINRALTQEECDRILAENGQKVQPWEQGKMDLASLGIEDPNRSDAYRKTLAPITYDDSGNVIPLSQRFNPDNPSVLYQSDEGGVSGQTLAQTNPALYQEAVDHVLLLLQRAWHGSPNEIEGGLSLTKIGSGEGQQIHGWGLYFAQSRKISDERYRQRLRKRNPYIVAKKDGGDVTEKEKARVTEAYLAVQALQRELEDLEDGLARLEKAAKLVSGMKDLPENPDDMHLREILSSGSIFNPYGAVMGHAKWEARQRLIKAGLLEKGDYATDVVPTGPDVAAAISRDVKEFKAAVKRRKADIQKQKRRYSKFTIHENKGTLLEMEIPESDVLMDEQLAVDSQPPKVLAALEALCRGEGVLSTMRVLGKTYRLTERERRIRLLGRTEEDSVWLTAIRRQAAEEEAAENARFEAEYGKYPRLKLKAGIPMGWSLREWAESNRPPESDRELLRAMVAHKDAINAIQERAAVANELLRTTRWRSRTSGEHVLAALQKAYANAGSATAAKAASQTLLSVGLPGLTYVGGLDGRCFVIWDDTAVSIINRYEQAAGAGRRGQVELTPQRAAVTIFKGDLSTIPHESAHIFVDDLKTIAEGDGSGAREDLRKALEKAGVDTAPFEGILDGTAPLETAREMLRQMRLLVEEGRNSAPDRRKAQALRKRLPALDVSSLDQAGRTKLAGQLLDAGVSQETAGAFLDGQTDAASVQAEMDEASLQGKATRRTARAVGSALADYVQAMDGLAQARADMRTLRRFAGVPEEGDLTQAQWIEVQEYAARGFEQYLSEGKSPTPELEGFFARMKEWLKNLYSSWKAYVGAELTDEVRQVFDRMLATEAEAKTDQTVQAGFGAEREFIADADLTEDERRELADMMNKAEAEVTARRDRAAKRLWAKKYREALAQAEEMLGADPFWNLVRTLMAQGRKKKPEGEKGPRRGGIKKMSLVEHLGEERAKELARRCPGLVNAQGGGTPVDILMFEEQYSLGVEVDPDALANRLYDVLVVEGRTFRKECAAMARQIADEETGQNVPVEDDFLGGEEYAAYLAEVDKVMRRLAKAAEKDPKRVKAAEKLQRARTDRYYRELARREIAGMSASRLSLGKWTAALRRALADRNRAALKGQPMAAVRAVERARFAFAMMQEVKAARDRADAVSKKVRKAAGVKAGTYAAVQTEAIRKLARALGFRVSDRAWSADLQDVAFSALLDQSMGDATALDVAPMFPEWIRNLANPDFQAEQRGEPLDFSRLTVAELDDVANVVDFLVHTGREQNRNAKDSLVARTEALASEAGQNMAKLPTFYAPQRGGFRQWLGRVFSSVDTIDWICRKADAFKNVMGRARGAMGVMEEKIYQPLRRAFDRYSERLAGTQAAVAPHCRRLMLSARDWARRYGKKALNVRDESGQLIGLPDALRRSGVNGWTPEMVISLALNLGNEGNRERLRSSYKGDGSEAGLTYDMVSLLLGDDAAVALFGEEAVPVQAALRPRREGLLSAEDWRAVQEIWNVLGSQWADTQAAHKRLYGFAPKGVDPAAFKVSVGGETVAMAGGYYPIRYDGEIDVSVAAQDQAQNILDRSEGLFAAPTARRGFTMQRVAHTGKSIRLGTDVLMRHLTDSARFIELAEDVQFADMVTRSPAFQSQYVRAFGLQDYSGIRPNLKSLVVDEAQPTGFMYRAAEWLRSHMTYYVLGLNLNTAILQLTAAFPAMGDLGVAAFMRGLGQLALRGPALVKEVWKASPYMERRYRNIDADIARKSMQFNPNGRTLVFGGKIFQWSDIVNLAMMPIGVADATISTAIWCAAYHKKLGELAGKRSDGRIDPENVNHQEAAEYADRIVAQSNPDNDSLSKSAFARDKGIVRLFNAFSSATTKFAQRGRYMYQGWRRGEVTTFEMGRMLMFDLLLTAMAMALIKGAAQGLLGSGDDDDKKELAALFGQMTVEQFAMLFPVFGNPAADLLSGVFHGETTRRGGGLLGTPVSSAAGLVKNLMTDGTAYASGEDDGTKLLMSTLAIGSYLAQVPGYPFGRRVARGYEQWQEGRGTPMSIFMPRPQ